LGEALGKKGSDIENGITNAGQILYHLGDVVYSFGEAAYYYDQFYDPFRNYPAPIFAVPGNHDGMVAPNRRRNRWPLSCRIFATMGDRRTGQQNQVVWRERRKFNPEFILPWKLRLFGS
jgi:predicted phosphodiesterase